MAEPTSIEKDESSESKEDKKEASVETKEKEGEIDEAYEFDAPQFFDFEHEETEEDIQNVEKWFEVEHYSSKEDFKEIVEIDSEEKP